MTPFLLLGPPHHLTIQWVRESTSLDSKLPDQTEVHIRTDLSSDPLAEREIVLILVAVYSHCGAADAVAEKPSSMITVS